MSHYFLLPKLAEIADEVPKLLCLSYLWWQSVDQIETLCIFAVSRDVNSDIEMMLLYLKQYEFLKIFWDVSQLNP